MHITGLLIGWFLLWILAWSIFLFFLKHGIDYIQAYRTIIGYFLCFSLLVAYIYSPFLTPFFSHLQFKIFPVTLLVLFFSFAFFIYSVGKSIFDKDILEKNKRQMIFFATFDFRFLLSKSFDILFQQTLLLSIVLILKSFILSKGLVILVTGISFGLVHLPALKIKLRKFAPYFIFFSFLAGLFFSFLIIFLPYGFLYSYITHWLFYIFSGVLFVKHISRKKYLQGKAFH